ncbi:MAG: YggT family protein [Chloroflexi bacterium]|nr:YggT family protein [Chloroflexota bacterium]
MALYLATFISLFAQILSLAIFARAILSWFPIGRDNPLTMLLVQITDPILIPLRRVIPPLGMFDLTPMIAIILLSVVSRMAQSLVYSL